MKRIGSGLVSLSTLFVCLLPLVSQTGCQKAMSPTRGPASTGIVHGQPLNGQEPFASSVIGLGFQSENGYEIFCSGSLIDAHTIVTAGHCLNDASSRDQYIVFGLTQNGADVQGRKITHYVVNEAYVVEAPDDAKDTNDIAIARFDGDAPAGFAPAHLLTDDSVLTKGGEVVLAGYGVDDGRTQENSGVLRATTVNILDVAYSNTEIQTDETKAGSCNGDSGGPAMVVANGVYYLWGITSRGDDTCTQNGIYTRLSPFKTWIAQHMPALDAPPAPVALASGYRR